MSNEVIFKKATKTQLKARLAFDGPAGSGKTYTALVAAQSLANGGKIAVLDTEHGKAALYADQFEFDHVIINNFNPSNYVKVIKAAEAQGYAVLIIDSLSHAWEGSGGVLDLHDQATAQSKSGNSYTAWRDVTPLHNKLVETILQSDLHVIATMRSKMEYAIEKDSKGQTIIRKVGLAPIQRQGMEYEFDVVADIDVNHNLTISKTRCYLLADTAVVNRPEKEFFDIFTNWLGSGEKVQTSYSENVQRFDNASQPARTNNTRVTQDQRSNAGQGRLGESSRGNGSPLPKQEERTDQLTQPAQRSASWRADIIDRVIKEGFADNPAHAINMLNLSNLDQNASWNAINIWCTTYTNARHSEGLNKEEAKAKADKTLKTFVY